MCQELSSETGSQKEQHDPGKGVLGDTHEKAWPISNPGKPVFRCRTSVPDICTKACTTHASDTDG